MDFISDYLSGMPISDLAEKYFVCEATIQYWIKKYNLSRPKIPNSKTRYLLKNKSKIQTDLLYGIPIYKLAHKYSVNRETLSNFIKSNNLVTKPKKYHGISKLANKNGLKPCTVYNRLNYGWSIEDALNVPVGGKSHVRTI